MCVCVCVGGGGGVGGGLGGEGIFFYIVFFAHVVYRWYQVALPFFFAHILQFDPQPHHRASSDLSGRHIENECPCYEATVSTTIIF